MAAARDEKDGAGREGEQGCPFPKALVQPGKRGAPGGTRVDNAALPSDAALLMFLMPRTAENWGSWLKKSQVVSWQCPGGCWDRAGLAHAKCRWPVTPG